MAPGAARLVLLLAVAATLTGRSEGGWCVCRADLPDATLQKTLDYACGGGADCRPIVKGGACFGPDTVRAHCSYAVNSFYQRAGQNPQACVFSGTAAVSPTDPSANGCLYPASQSAAGTGGTGGTIGGVDSPPALAQGPSSYNDSSSSTSVFPVAGIAKRAVILACCSLLALYFMASSRRQGTLSQSCLGVLFLGTFSHSSGGRKEPFNDGETMIWDLRMLYI